MARRHIVGRFPSAKMDRMIRFNSSIERDLIYWLDFSSPVISFQEQPFPIIYHKEGRSRDYRYTPDFFVETRGGQMFVIECKPQSKINTERNQLLCEVAQQWCAENSMTFVVVTDRFLRDGVWLANVKELALYAQYVVTDWLCATIERGLAQRPLTIGDVINMLHLEPRQSYPLICSLIFHGELHIPLFDSPISMETPLLLNPAEPYLWLPQLGVGA